MRILIAGAGIGGLMAALALAQKGFEVAVYEQAAQLGEVGAGVQMSANGSRLFYELGIGDELSAVACHPTGKEIRLWSSGQTWQLFDLGSESIDRYGYPYLMLHRADMHRVLADALNTLRPGCVHLSHKVKDIQQAGSRVTLHFEQGASAVGDVLIGADGVHSVVRRCLFGTDQPVFTGCMAWRGLIPAEQLSNHLQRPIGINWVGPGRHVVHYPVRRNELVNFVGIVERDDWQQESWNQRGTQAECAQDFVGWHSDVQEMIAHIETPYKWALMGRPPLPTWQQGRISLLGDACHPTLPFLAQGAMMALEDAIVLARCLERFADQPETALARYESVRLERTSKIVVGSTENAKRFHNPLLRDAAGAQSYVSNEWTPEKINARYTWLFEYNAATVAIDPN
jgi:salicylate hydroxylase